MTQKVLKTINESGVAILTLNRPELHNAFDAELIQTLLDMLTAIDKNPQVKAVILAATGKSFSAGADLSSMNATETHVGVKWLPTLMKKT